MGCFLSCGKRKKRANNMCSNQDTKSDDQFPSNNIEKQKVNPLLDMKTESSKDGGSDRVAPSTCKLTFTFQELAIATNNFGADFLIGEDGFGRVYKGWLQSDNQIVAIKQLNQNQPQRNQGFLNEVLMLSLLHHPNLVGLIGYCSEGDHRLLVYEYIPRGSLKDHLHNLPSDQNRLDWNTRMKIAAGVAKGLEFLHDIANPNVIHRNLKCSSILLDEEYHPKLSDFGLAKLGPVGDKTYLSTSVEGTFGYIAPENAMTGELSVKSDVYSFGVVLLEIITGRKAVDCSRAVEEESLVAWARSLFKDCRKFSEIVDPTLQDRYPAMGLYQALVIAVKCVEEKPSARPAIADVATTLDYLASEEYDPQKEEAKGLAFYREMVTRRTMRHLRMISSETQ